MGKLLYLSRADVERLLDVDAMLDALGSALIALSSGTTSVPPRIAARVPDLGLMGAMAGYVPGVALEVKLVSVFPQNHHHGQPSHQGLIALFDEHNGAPLAVMDGTLFFSADDGVHGRELWRSDASALGTELVADLRPGAPGSGADSLTAVGETLFFRGDDGIHGRELWRSSGTELGTALVADVRPGAEGSSLGWLTTVSSVLYFTADDGAHGVELWRSDGSVEGTALASDVQPGPDSSAPGTLTVVRDVLFFSADDGTHGRELWRADGLGATAFSSGPAARPVALGRKTAHP